ncbi:hypothetical protein [Acidicapsa ligni]|uniref:hypothetical protein n=1 Tax=Acidicapsa ligni TaxID=542300 RepID=UPI0021DFD2A4|nr:hypothetical protein [Acidicapsa ligni]
MEADWEVEIGARAPVLDPLWSGFVDLRATPNRISELAETLQFPPLASALAYLNSVESSLWTAKCDIWTIEDPSQIDPDEMEATIAEAAAAQACYVDVLPERQSLFVSLEQAESFGRNAVLNLRTLVSRCSRVDLIIRQAVAGEQQGFGITVYITACGASPTAAEETLASALAIVANTLCTTAVTLIQP